MRIRTASFSVLVLLSAVACGGEPPPAPPPAPVMNGPKPVVQDTPSTPPLDADDAAIDKAAQAYVDLVLDISPESATGLGLHARDGLLDDRSLEGFEANTKKEEAMLKDLQTRFANPNASMRAKTDLEILEHTLEVDVRIRRDVKPLVTQPDYVLRSHERDLLDDGTRLRAGGGARRERARRAWKKMPKMLEGAKPNIAEPAEGVDRDRHRVGQRARRRSSTISARS